MMHPENNGRVFPLDSTLENLNSPWNTDMDLYNSKPRFLGLKNSPIPFMQMHPAQKIEMAPPIFPLPVDFQDTEKEEDNKKYVEVDKYVEAEAKVDILLERTKLLEQEKQDIFKEVERLRKANNDLQDNIKAIEEEALTIETSEIQNDTQAATRIFLGNGISWERKKQMLEDKQRREREKMKNEIMLGADFLNQDDGFQIFVTEGENCLTRLYNWLGRVVDCLIPCGDDVRYLKSKYDRSISGYFEFARFLIGFNMVTFLCFLSLLLFHILEYDQSYSKFCDDVYPCLAFFSNFTSDFATLYSSTLYLFLLIALVGSIFRWIHYYRDNTRYSLYQRTKGGKSEIRYSKKLFNWWDFSLHQPIDCFDLNRYNCNDFGMLLSEDQILHKIEQRTISENASLWIRRILLLILNIIILGIGWFAIAVVYYFEKDIKSFFSTFPGLNLLSSFIPGIVMSIVKVLIPIVCLSITACEKWDFASTKIKNEIWKLFFENKK